MAKIVCPCCGRPMDEVPLDIAFNRPELYVRLSKADREARAWFTNDDYCVIDDCQFFIRGFVPIPIIETDRTFGWGFWCKISQADFKRYRHLDTTNTDGSNTPPFEGFIANAVDGYADIEGLRVSVQPGAPDKRPIMTLMPADHLLYREQSRGITMKRAHELSAKMVSSE